MDTIDLDNIDDTIIKTEKDIIEGIGINPEYQIQVVKGIFSVLGPSMHQLLTWFVPSYADETKDQNMNFIDILHWLMASDFISYFSETTLEMFGELVYAATQDDWALAEKTFLSWEQKKVDYFFKHLKVLEWGWFAPTLLFHYYEKIFGKIDPMNVMFTALPWTILSPFGVFTQILFMIFENKFFAEGNVLLLGL